MRIKWTVRARESLRECAAFIARENPAAARGWAQRIRQRLRILARHPLAGRRLQEFTEPAVRQVLAGTYRLLYRVVDKTIQVVLVAEGHRMIGPAELGGA